MSLTIDFHKQFLISVPYYLDFIRIPLTKFNYKNYFNTIRDKWIKKNFDIKNFKKIHTNN